MDSYSDISVIDSFTGTQSSSSTIPGLGSLSGKAIKRLGEVVLNGVDYILVNRQLSRIEARLRRTHGFWEKDETEGEMYSILLELTHPNYPFPVQTRALRIIMERIGGMNFKALSEALVKEPSSTIHRHLSSINDCLWSSRGIGVSTDTATTLDTLLTKKIATYQAAGYEAYTTAITAINSLTSILSSSEAFILYLTFIATIGSREHARIIFELDIARFLDLTIGSLFGPFLSHSEIIAGRLLMHVIALKLDPIQDSDAMLSINNSISTLKNIQPITSGSETVEPTGSSSIMDDDDDGDIPRGWLQTLRSKHLLHPTPFTDISLDAIEFIKAKSLTRNLSVQPIEEMQVLLLGCGDCGKTTIMEQLIFKLSHRGLPKFIAKYSDPVKYRSLLLLSILLFLKGLIDGSGYDPKWAKNFPRSVMIEQLDTIKGFNSLLSFIWTYTRGFSFLQPFADKHTHYHLSVLMRIAELPSFKRESYEPTGEDLLQLYISDTMPGLYTNTTGIYEGTSETPARKYHIWDCGGQRSERNMWIHGVLGVSMRVGVVLFVASLVDYDQIEDGVTNRMQDALSVFRVICHSPSFFRARIVLVLTKRDLLKQKLMQSPFLEHYFPDYTGGVNENAAVDYIKTRFLLCSQYRSDRVPVFVLDATSTEEVKALFDSINYFGLSLPVNAIH